ncbi:serine/threonine-protein kinase [Acidobacteria bacterium AH-259-L09]|nr:serine/threonine-protein kinase [Acidobacteria bacterium AH-259-L09]
MIGQTVSHYKILEKLGEGGMGEVFLAQDTSLDRKVALKFLPDFMQEDPTARKRFLREAKSAAALDHPFICKIYEVGEADGKDFIAMEYVQGTTLKDKLAEGALALKDALRKATEIAEALEAAHKHDIVHRDLKPSNIMLTPEGHIKVMDFGLAKRLVPAEGIGSQEQTISASLTKTGATLGTPAYMSPEQLRGQDVDTRSDVFSFGVVLYEMLSGVHPFRKDLPMDTANALLSQSAPPLTRYTDDVPGLLQHTVKKMLAKEPDGRYQLIHDVGTDLGELLEDMVRAAPSGLRKYRPRHLIGSAVGLALVVGGLSWFYFSRPVPESSLPPMKTVPFTSFAGLERFPAFSPDGNQIAFSWNGEAGDNFDIYVKLIGAGKPLRLSTHPASESNPVWSPDGRHIAFIRESGERSAVFLIPSLGGPERKLTDVPVPSYRGDTGTLDWSPDGEFLTLSDAASRSEPLSVFLFSLQTREKTQLTFPPAQSRGDRQPAFSPDGQTLAFVRQTSWAVEDIHLVLVSGGEPRPLTHDNRRVLGLAWTADGREIVFSSDREGSRRLWRISIAGGAPKPLGIGEDAHWPVVSRQGHRLAYTQSRPDPDIWRTAGPRATDSSVSPKKLIYSTREEHHPQFSPDGKRIAFSSNRSGNSEIWLCDADGSNPEQLTFFGGAGSPRWSPDGRQIAFDSAQEGNKDIYLLAVEGGLPRRLTTETSADVRPSWSKDGHWIYFGSNRSGDWQVWKVSADGASAVQVTKNGGREAFASPDGKFVYYTKPTGVYGLWKVPVAGGEEVRILERVHQSRWGVWKEGIVFRNTAATPLPAIESFDFRNRQVVPLSTIKPLDLGGVDQQLSVSPDGQWILYNQAEQSESDIMLAENFH